MVAYETVIHLAADRELNALDDADRDRLTDVLTEVAERRQPTDHEKASHLDGQDGLFRVRAGELRAICRLEKPTLQILKVGHRDTVYRDVDDLDERLPA